MRKTVFLVVSLLMVFGLAGISMAQTSPINDPNNDSYLATVDLTRASVQTYGKAGAGYVPSWVNLGIRMNTGDHLPGMIMWDFDVDQNASTGGGSTLTMPFATAEGPDGPFKPDKGFEFYVVMALRTQANTSQTALSAGCTGGGYQCVTRGPGCTGCSPSGTYYELGDACIVGAPDCYEVLPGTFSDCNEGNCYPLDSPCGTTPKDCAMGLLVGEWYAAAGISGTPFIRGKVPLDVATFNIHTETSLCATLPWAEMVARARNVGVLTDDQLFFTADNPPQWQVSVWYDAAPFDGDDMFDAGLVLNLVDFAPNTGRATAVFNANLPCLMNQHGGYGDIDVDADDITLFLSEFGREEFFLPCPGCL